MLHAAWQFTIEQMLICELPYGSNRQKHEAFITVYSTAIKLVASARYTVYNTSVLAKLLAKVAMRAVLTTKENEQKQTKQTVHREAAAVLRQLCLRRVPQCNRQLSEGCRTKVGSNLRWVRAPVPGVGL